MPNHTKHYKTMPALALPLGRCLLLVEKPPASAKDSNGKQIPDFWDTEVLCLKHLGSEALKFLLQCLSGSSTSLIFPCCDSKMKWRLHLESRLLAQRCNLSCMPLMVSDKPFSGRSPTESSSKQGQTSRRLTDPNFSKFINGILKTTPSEFVKMLQLVTWFLVLWLYQGFFDVTNRDKVKYIGRYCGSDLGHADGCSKCPSNVQSSSNTELSDNRIQSEISRIWPRNFLRRRHAPRRCTAWRTNVTICGTWQGLAERRTPVDAYQ